MQAAINKNKKAGKKNARRAKGRVCMSFSFESELVHRLFEDDSNNDSATLK